MMTDEFIDSLVAEAADLALLSVGVPALEMLGALFELRAGIQADLVERFGHEVAAVIAESFVATVVLRRREIEAGGATSRVLN